MARRILLVHGLSSSSAGWWRVRGWLENADWQVETIELRGHGGSPPAASYALDGYVADLAATGPWDAVLAHSLGGSAATVAAARDAAWTARLALLDPVWRIPAAQWDAVVADQEDELALTREALLAAKPHWHPRDVAAKLAALAQVDPAAVTRSFIDTAPDTHDWDLLPDALSLAVPTLVLGGDPAVYTMLEPDDATMVTAANPEVDYRIVSGAGHSPHRDVPELTRELLLEWLAGEP